MPVSSSQHSFHGAREFMTASQQLSVVHSAFSFKEALVRLTFAGVIS